MLENNIVRVSTAFARFHQELTSIQGKIGSGEIPAIPDGLLMVRGVRLAYIGVLQKSFTPGEEVLLYSRGEIISAKVADIAPNGGPFLVVTISTGDLMITDVAAVLAAECEAMRVGEEVCTALATALGVASIDPTYKPSEVWTVTDIKFPGVQDLAIPTTDKG